MGEEGKSFNFWQVVATAVISGGVASAVVSGVFGVLKSDADIEQKNVELVLKMHQDHLQESPEQAAIYAALMVDGKLISRNFGCNLVGLSLFTGKSTPNVINAVRSVLREDLIASSFSSPPCDIAGYGKERTATQQDSPPPDSIAQNASCPIGQLYSQFGAEEQRAFGLQLQRGLNAAGDRAEAPQIIKGFDARDAVVRYFFVEMEGEARKWHDLLEALLPGFDVKYAYVPGYEAAIGADNKATFELWWPAGLAPPSEIGTASCKPVVADT